MIDLATFKGFVEQANPHTVFAPLGIRVVSYEVDAFQVAIDVDERHFQHLGVVHGGIYALLAESAASMAAARSVDMSKHIVAGVDLNATHLKPKRSGTRHRDRAADLPRPDHPRLRASTSPTRRASWCACRAAPSRCGRGSSRPRLRPVFP